MAHTSDSTYLTLNEALLESVKSCDDLDTLGKIAFEADRRRTQLQMKQRLEYLPALISAIRNFVDQYGDFVVATADDTVVSLGEFSELLEAYRNEQREISEIFYQKTDT